MLRSLKSEIDREIFFAVTVAIILKPALPEGLNCHQNAVFNCEIRFLAAMTLNGPYFFVKSYSFTSRLRTIMYNILIGGMGACA